MAEDYTGALQLHSGADARAMILHQTGSICREVYEMTIRLVKLADRTFDPKWMSELASAMAKKGRLKQAEIGNFHHHKLYELAKQAQEKGWLPPEMKITTPVRLKGDRSISLRGIKRRDDADFVWRTGPPAMMEIAWDLTTRGDIANHYQKHVQGIKRGDRRIPENDTQRPEDNEYPWDAYIAIVYNG